MKNSQLFIGLLLLLSFVISCAAQSKSTEAAINNLEKDIPQLMKAADVPGLSATLISDGKIVWSKGFGFQNAESKEPVTNETVFEAASLSKVVFAYAVLKLVDEGKLDLDTPLNKYLGNNYEVGDDSRLNLITARRVLTHTSGFPNWRAPDAKALPIDFTPGEKFSYSGEGFEYLSAVVKKITQMELEDFMQKTVLQPLGMTNSSYQWQNRYDKTGAYRHDLFGKKLFRNQGDDVGVAYSLRTTSTDYARFVAALLNAKGLKKKTWQAMFTPHVNVDAKSPQVFWGFGIGLEMPDKGKYIWHWGDQGNTKAYFTADLSRKSAVVYFANGFNGLSLAAKILDDAIGGNHPAITHLGYEQSGSPSFELSREVFAKGAVDALNGYRQKRTENKVQTINEAQINNLGNTLLRWKKFDDAIEVFKQNTIDFSNSANAWESLAEAYLKKGNKESAIKCYEKSLEINPNNQFIAEKLEELKS